MIDEHLPHLVRGNGENLLTRPLFPPPALAPEPQEELMHQRGPLERMLPPFPPEQARGDSLQFRANRPEQFLSA